MKKVLFAITAFLGLSLALVATGCSGGGSDDDYDDFASASFGSGGSGERGSATTSEDFVLVQGGL